MARKKVIVAVHGVGDQFRYSTIQSVVNQFCTFYGVPAAVPLGSFHGTVPLGAPVPPFAQDSAAARDLAFAEVYWADIPRKSVNTGYTIEDSKTWVRTIAGRIRVCRARRGGCSGSAASSGMPEHDFRTLRTVLGEMVEGISVIERLLFLAEKVGVFKFDLGRVLTAYVNDVQVVTEFEDHRKQILASFSTVMQRVSDATGGYQDADIYIVAHSEGSVVAFLGLLEALCEPAEHPWVERIRGMMTIGSPIDKHLTMWPDLWAKYKQPKLVDHSS